MARTPTAKSNYLSVHMPLTKTEQKVLDKLLLRKEATEDGFAEFIKSHTPATPATPAMPVPTLDPVKAILDQRGSRYGDFSDHARLAQQLQDCLRNHCVPAFVIGGITTTHLPWLQLDAVKKQALIVITDKLARILNGDPNYADNWMDIQGYARLVEERLPKVSENGADQATPAS